MEDQLFNDEMLIGIRTGAKLIEVKKTNGLVKLNKEFLGIELGFLNKKELELLYILCLAYKERQVQSIKIHIKEIKELMSSGEKEIRKTDIENYVETLHKRLAKVNIRTNKSGISGTLNLFEYVITDTRDFETGIVTIIAKVTDTAMNFFNNLEGKRNKYLRFLIEDAIKLKGKYSALLLPHLIACSKVKEFEITTESLEEILGIKGKYSRKTDFNKRILKPTVEELEIIFKDLKVKALKKNELDPRKITHYKFTWSNNINYDDKKEETSFFVEIEETNSNDKKEYSKIFINDNVIDKTEEIEVAEVKVEAVDETDEELTAEEEIKKFISENIPTLNYKSIEKNIKSRLENGENSEEIIAFIKRNWHRAIDDDKYKSKIGILKKALEDNFELNLTKEEIQKEKNILNGKGILHKEVKYVKSDWSNSDIEEAKKKDTVKEKVKEIENITYKEYLEVKEKKINLFNVDNNKDTINLSIQKTSFNNYLRLNYNVTLTKSEWEKEIKDLAQRFYSNNIKEATEVYKNFFIIKEEATEEVKEEVAVADVDVKKENAEVEKVIVETDEEKINQYLEFKEWEEEISKLPSMFELTEVHYKLFMFQKYMEERKLCELDEEYSEVQEKIWQLEDEKDRLNKKLEEEKEKLWNTKFSKQAKERLKNIKTVEREKLDF